MRTHERSVFPRSSTCNAAPDRPAKLDRIRRILAERDADAIRLTSPTALAWLLDGARSTVPTGGPAIFSARVDRAGDIVVTAPRNEADRLVAEELGGCALEIVPWHADVATRRSDELPEGDVAEELRAARASLLPEERDRYRRLGRDAAGALTHALRAATPGLTEHDLAGRVAAQLRERGCEPSVVLVGGASRAHVPHPLPTFAPLGAHALAVATAVRDGLHLSLSRWVTFDAGAAVRTVYDVEADVWAATRPGRTLAEILADIDAAYVRHGADPDGASGWRLHHQGGPTGYAGRDPKAGPETRNLVVPAQAFAWNPWVPGGKVEDTIVVDGPGDIEILSADPTWPTTTVAGRPRPDILDLS